MNGIKSREAFPKVTEATKDGWKMTVSCVGVYTEFVQYVAQAGDPKGTITLEGPNGIKISIGKGRGSCPCCGGFGRQVPVNLNKGRELVDTRIRNEIRDRYNVEPDRDFLLSLGKEAFAPYNLYGHEF